MNIEELKELVTKTAGISEEQADKAVTSTLAYLKEHEENDGFQEKFADFTSDAKEKVGDFAEDAQEAFGKFTSFASKTFGSVKDSIFGDDDDKKDDKKDEKKDEKK